MSDYDDADEQWQTCQPGQIREMVYALNAKERVARLATGAKAVATAAIVIAVAAFFWADQPQTLHGITCSECRANFAAFRRHTDLGDGTLDPTFARNMQGHLDDCQTCRELYQRQYGDLTAQFRNPALEPKPGFFPEMLAMNPPRAKPGFSEVPRTLRVPDATAGAEASWQHWNRHGRPRF